jgi:hypothetical protein
MGREQAAIATAIVSAEQAGRAFPLDPGRVLHGMGGEGEDWRAQSGADDLGLAPGRRSESRGPPAAAVMTNRPAKRVSGRYSPAHLRDGSDQNGGNR